jgi:phosphoglycolate phosphatase
MTGAGRPDDVAAWRLACLDMAGTTVRDDGLVELAFTAAVEKLGVVAGTDAYDKMLAVVRETMGQSKIEVFRRLFGDEAAAVRANLAFESAYADQVAGGAVVAIPGAIETIARLRSDGVRVALSTGFARTTQDAILDALGWRGAVDLAICPSDGVRGRPYPDLVLAAAAALGIDEMPAVVVVGDTPADIRSGLAADAGLVVGVLTGASDRGMLSAAGAMRTLGSIGELPGLLGLE